MNACTLNSVTNQQIKLLPDFLKLTNKTKENLGFKDIFLQFSILEVNSSIQLYNTGKFVLSPTIRRDIERIARNILQMKKDGNEIDPLQHACSNIMQKLSVEKEEEIVKNFVNHLLAENSKFACVFNKIIHTIEESKHSSLVYYKNSHFNRCLSLHLSLKIINKNYECHYNTVEKILQFHDFHIVGDYLRALDTRNEKLKELIEQLDNFNPNYSLIDQYRYADFFKNNQNKPAKQLVNCLSLEDIFTEPKEGASSVRFFFPGNVIDPDILTLFDTVSGHLEDFIDSCLDLEGINSIVRKGLIKKFQISINKHVIAKKNNPDKVGRFKNEVSNYRLIMERLNIQKPGDCYKMHSNEGIEVVLKMLHPLAFFLDTSTENYYSISPFQEGKTLEEILRASQNPRERAQHLANVKEILKVLYANGIVWGDMAPRNIIIRQVGNTWEYYIFDFEKTKVFDATSSVSYEDKIEHHRGPMCVEEFGAVCSPQEINATFGEYFQPDHWDLALEAPVRFKPKREIVDILKQRGNTSFTMGQYNHLEIAIIPVRAPLYQNLQKIYPIDPSFKIDHYIGSEFDRKTTEIYMTANTCGVLYEVVELLNAILAIVDSDLMIDDIHSIIHANHFKFDRCQMPSFILLKEIIDSLYLAKDKKSWEENLSYFHRKIFLMASKQSSCEYMPEISKNIEFSREQAETVIRDLAQKYHLDLVLVSGSYYREEITFNSDIELFIFGKESLKARSAIQSAMFACIGMYIDVYPIDHLSKAEKFLEELPDYFIDFQNTRLIYGSQEQYEHFLETKNKIFNKNGFLLEALYKQEVFLKLRNEENFEFNQGKIKYLLNIWNVIEAFQDFYTTSTILANAQTVKERLLYYKNHAEFCECYGIQPTCSYDYEFEMHVQLTLSQAFNDIEKIIKDRSSNEGRYIKQAISLNTRHISTVDYHSSIAPFYVSEQAYTKVHEAAIKYLEPSINKSQFNIQSGQGALLTTFEGKQIIDLSSMTANCILGQNDPWVKIKQIAYLISDAPSFHSSKLGSYYYFEIPRLIGESQMGGIVDPSINHKQCNGSDVTEIAIKAAFHHSNGREKIISFSGSYHGQNLTAYNISDLQTKHNFLNPLNESVTFLPSPPSKKVWNTPSILEERALTQEEKNIVEQLSKEIKNSYAIILEPIQGNNELRMFSLPLLRKIKQITQENDVCLIFDEIQTGFGWLGKMTAAELYGITPDILLLSKAITSGNGPLAIAIFGGKYKASVPYGASEKTGGADLRSLAAFSAVFERLNGISNLQDLSEIEKIDSHLKQELSDGLLKQYENKAKLLQSCIANLISDFGDIIEKSIGMGLMRGLKIHSFKHSNSHEITQEIYKISLQKGVFLRVIGNHCLIIKPPLVISEDEIYIAFRYLHEAFDEVRKNLIVKELE